MTHGGAVTDPGRAFLDRALGGRIRAERTATGWSQSDLARMIGVTFQQVQKYEKGTNRVSASMLWTIAMALGVSASAFFEGGAEPDVAGEPDPDRAYMLRNFDRIHDPAARQTLCKLAELLAVREQNRSGAADSDRAC